MSRASAPHRQLAGRLGGLKSWANTVDRTERTKRGRDAGPGSIDYWVDRLPPQFADATDEQKHQAALAAKRAHYAELALKSAQARRRKADRVPAA